MQQMHQPFTFYSVFLSHLIDATDVDADAANGAAGRADSDHRRWRAVVDTAAR
jgi:hypothetical protein